MRILIIPLLMIFSGCEEIDYKIPPLERCVYSYQFNKCRCHMYDIMKMERIGESYDLEVSYCDDIVGFKASDWAEQITPKGKRLMEFAEKYMSGQCQNYP